MPNPRGVVAARRPQKQRRLRLHATGSPRPFPLQDRSIWYCCARSPRRTHGTWQSAHAPCIVAVERPKPQYRGVLHTWCALSSPVWCGYQLSLCDAGNALAAGLSLFAMVFLFSSSAMFHRGRWTLAQERRLMKLDYIGIFMLVAFSVAPCYVQLLPPAASYPVLGAPLRPPPSSAHTPAARKRPYC